MIRGVKPLTLPPADFLDLVLWWLMEHEDAKGLAELERTLTMPPTLFDVDPDDPVWSAESEMAMFAKAARQR